MKEQIAHFFGQTMAATQLPGVQAAAAVATIGAAAGVVYFGGKAMVMTVCIVGGGIAAAIATKDVATGICAVGYRMGKSAADLAKRMQEAAKHPQPVAHQAAAAS